MLISGDVNIDFWSAVRRTTGCEIRLTTAADVIMFLRDHDGVGGFTDIGSGTLSVADCQCGISDFVEKTISITGISYTVPAGHDLELKVIVPSTAAPADQIGFAYDTMSFPSVVNLP